MLVADASGERVGSTIVKDSKFYIEVAKFVQAYRTIVVHPNVFLKEIGAKEIDEEHVRLTWQQFVSIVQNVDLGFDETPSNEDLLVYYNYALQIGSFEGLSRKIATVDDVANAQKHYYNFVDEAVENAQIEYLKQHKIYESRDKEVKEVENHLSKIKSVNILSFTMMTLGVIFCIFGVVCFFAFSMFLKWNFAGEFTRFVVGLIFIVIGIILFAIFDKYFVKSRKNYYNLKVASEMIFKRTDDSFNAEQVLKRKLDELTNDLKIVQSELNDEEKTFDVKHNIERIKSTNKFYKELCENEIEAEYDPNELKEFEQKYEIEDEEAEFAPVKLTKEQEENLARVSREAITLEGKFDEKAYNEKFERSREERERDNQSESELGGSSLSEREEELEDAEKEKQEKQEEQEKQESQNQINEMSEQEMLESIDYIKELLGLSETENQRENY